MPQEYLKQLINSLVNKDHDSAKEHFKNHIDMVAPNVLTDNAPVEVPSDETE